MNSLLRLLAIGTLLASSFVSASHHHHQQDKQLASGSASAAAAVSKYDDFPLRFGKPQFSKIDDDAPVTIRSNSTAPTDDWRVIFSTMLPCHLNDLYSAANFVPAGDGQCHTLQGQAYGRAFASYTATVQPEGYKFGTMSLFGGGACELQTLVQVYALADNTWSIADLRTQDGFKYSIMCFCQGEQGPFGKFCQN
jgi:hypothetical protein